MKIATAVSSVSKPFAVKRSIVIAWQHQEPTLRFVVMNLK